MNTLSRDIEITPIKVNGSRTELNVLTIEIDHDKGGYSNFTGEYHQTGIIFRISPKGKHNGIVSQIIDGKTEHMGFYVFLLPCGRKSPKRMQMIANDILPHGEEIADLFLKGEYTEIANLVTKLAF